MALARRGPSIRMAAVATDLLQTVSITRGLLMSTRRTTSATRLLGLGLTPGKLRGLQRICNDNGTLTMVATDQNSSMISMMKDALKKKGEDREPTFNEIVEAKIHLSACLTPHCIAILVDGYYGVWNSVASFAIPPDCG